MPPISLLIDLLTQVIAPALAVSALALFLSGRGRLALAGPALALAAGFAASNWVRQAWPWRHDHSAWQWLPAVMLAALTAAVLARLLPAWAGWLMRAAAAALAAWLLVPVDLRIEKAWWPAAFLATVLASWFVLERSSDRETGWSIALGLAGACVGGAIVLLHSHTARLADGAFMIGAALAGIALMSRRRQLDVATALAAPAIFLPGLMLSGHYETADFSDVPAACFLLIGLTPLVLALAWLPPLARLPPYRLALVRIGLLLIPAISAVVLAMRAAPMQFQ